MDPSLTDDISKKRGADEELSSRDDQRDTPIPSAKRKLGSVLNVPKKQQNNMLLLNAMKTTAIHSNTSFSSHALETGIESAATESIHAASGVRSSTTPVPAATRGGTPKGVASAPTPQEAAVKAPAGGGKKKRKREQIVAVIGAHGLITISQGLPFESRMIRATCGYVTDQTLMCVARTHDCTPILAMLVFSPTPPYSDAYERPTG